LGKSPRRENLALIYQEILTVTTRLRASRQAVMDAESFRTSMKAAFSAAEADAARKGYTPDDARLASFAVVAFLDESVAGINDPNFADWSRRSLQQELYGESAGDTFYQCIERLLTGGDTPQIADALEVFGLCLLLGYRGRRPAGGQGEVQEVVNAILEKVQRVRGQHPLAPEWAPSPDGVLQPPQDPWVRALVMGTLGALFLAVLFFAGYKVALLSGASALHSIGLLTPH
jgi:type VI secretion system protein ImpK